MAGAKAKAAAKPGADKGKGKAKAKKPAPKPKPSLHGSIQAADNGRGSSSAPCACGGQCPRCQASKKRAAPDSTAGVSRRTKPERPHTDIAAEREAQRLGQHLRLIGAPPAQDNGQVAKPTARRATKLRETRAPHPRLTRARRLTAGERYMAEEALGYDLDPVRIHTGATAHALADVQGAAAFTHGNHIVLSAFAERASPLTRAQIIAHELIHVVQQSAPPVLAANLPRAPRNHQAQPRGPSIQPMIRAPPQVQCLSLDDLEGYADAAVSTVAEYGSDAVDGVVEFAGDVADVGLDAVREAVDFFAPGLWDFLSGGALEDMAELLCDGVDLVLGTVFEGIKDIDIMTSLEETFSGLATDVRTAQGNMTRAVQEAVGVLFEPFVDALEEWGTPLIGFIQTITSAVSGAATSAWDNIAVPALDFLEAAGGAVWETFTGFVTWLWDLIKPLRERAEWAWNRVTDFFGLVWDSTSGIRDTLADFAKEAFDSFLELIEPIKTPLMVVGGIILLISPLGPLIIITQVVPPLYEKITWLVQNWNKLDIVVEARQYLHDTLLPEIMSVVDSVKSALVGAAVWLAALLGELAKGMAKVVGAFTGNRCLESVNEVIEHIDDQVTRFELWAKGGFEGLNEALGAAFDALRALFEPILNFLVKLLMVGANPFMLPIAITAAIWLLLPPKIKPRVIKFVLALIIAAVEAIPTFLPGLFPLASVLKSGVLGFLRHVAGDSVTDDQRVNAANKIAHLATGGGVQFIAGYVVGILRGLLEGIIDPFKLLFMIFDLIMKGIAVVGRVVSRVITLISPNATEQIQGAVRSVVGPPPPGVQKGTAKATGKGAPTAGTQQAPTEQSVAETGTVETMQRAGQGRVTSTIRRETVANSDTAPMMTEAQATGTDPATDTIRQSIHEVRPPNAQRNAPRGGTVTTDTMTRAPPSSTANENAAPSGVGESGQHTITEVPEQAANTNAAPGPEAGAADGGDGAEEVSLESDLTDEQIIAHMDPAVLQGGVPTPDQEVSAEGLEQSMREETTSRGSSVRGLSQLLGDAWDALMGGAARVGGMAANALLEFLALPDYQLGDKIGWLTGMILFELLLNYFTGGGYMVIQKGAKIGTKLLAYFLRFLDMGGAIFGVLGKGLAKLRGPVTAGLDVASGFLSRFRFLDNILGRVRAGAEWLFRFGDDVAQAAHIARHGRIDNVAGRGVAGLSDEAAEGIARTADDVPALTTRAADDAPTGVTRAADEAPSGVGRVADDAPVPARTADSMPTRAPDDAPGVARTADDAPVTRGADDGATAASRQADEAADRTAREAIEEAGGHPPRGGLDEAADGTRRTADDAPPTIRDEALRASQYPQALAAARQIAEINDATNQPIPVVMGALMALKTRYRWISHFVARPIRGVSIFRIGMVASPEAPVDGHYSVYETPAPPPPRAADPDAWRHELPHGSTVIDQGPHHVAFRDADGVEHIRFDTREARTANVATEGRNMSDEARAGVSPDGRPYVHEGRHRSVGASQGGHIPEGAGGVPGHPEILQFHYTPNPAPGGGRNVRDLTIDHRVPEMDPTTVRHYNHAEDIRYSREVRNRPPLPEADRLAAEPRFGRELGEDIANSTRAAPNARTVQQPDGTLRADPAPHGARSNLDAMDRQRPAAIAAAHMIVALNDRINAPPQLILAQLMSLKSTYRWIDTFEARPLGGMRFRFFLIASRLQIGDADLGDDALLPNLPARGPPRGSAVHADGSGARFSTPTADPDVVVLRPGSRSPNPDAVGMPRAPTRDGLLPDAPAHPSRINSNSDEIAEVQAETIAENRLGIPESRYGTHTDPHAITPAEVHSRNAARFETNRVMGDANEHIFTRHLDSGTGPGAGRFDNVAEQVYIRPITGYDAAGNPIFANYRVRADNIARDRATGGLHVLDAKTTPRAPLTRNQQAGYPLIAANGGRLESRGLQNGMPRGMEYGTVLGPTPVSRAQPTTNLLRDELPPGGRPVYEFEAIPPAPGGRTRPVPVNPPAHPPMQMAHAGAPPTPAMARQNGLQAADDILAQPPTLIRSDPPTPVGNGGLRAVDEPGVPTIPNAGAKLAQMPEALVAARSIIAAGDAINLSAPLMIGQLMLLKRRYRWINTFEAQPTGGLRFSFYLIASRTKIGDADLGDESAVSRVAAASRTNRSTPADIERSRLETVAETSRTLPDRRAATGTQPASPTALERHTSDEMAAENLQALRTARGSGQMSGDLPLPNATRVVNGRLPTGRQTVDPTEISFSQATVSAQTTDGIPHPELVRSMRENGWQGDPIDVVNGPDFDVNSPFNGPTSVDNRRLLAARQAGIGVEANVHNAGDLLTPAEAARFAVDDDIPSTWGEAVMMRAGRQSGMTGVDPTWSERFPYGSIYDPDFTRPRR